MRRAAWPLLAVLTVWVVGGLGLTIRAADVGAAAVDEPQYLLTALSLAEDRNLDISDERAHVRYEDFHRGPLPVQASVLEHGRRVSPHDPLLPLLVAPAMALGGYLAVKAWLVVLAGLGAGALVMVTVSRFRVSAPLATAVAVVVGASTPYAVYAHQVYPEMPAALAVLAGVAALVPRRDRGSEWTVPRMCLLAVAVTALPWLSVKYVPVAAGLAGVGLWGMARHSRRRAFTLTAVLAVGGGIWLALHRVWYGGWTAYATGDAFAASGEFGVMGSAPDLWGRSTRLIGLLVDRDYGIAAWQPAWLLVPLAVGFLLAARVPHRAALLVPMLLGWFSATFVALTMHGFWWPGRQIVVIVPVMAIAVAIALDGLVGTWGRVIRSLAAAAATFGLAIHAWVLLAGHRGVLTWVLVPDVVPPVPILWWNQVLPDYRRLVPLDWVLHGTWVVVALALAALGVHLGRRAFARVPASDRDARGPATGHRGPATDSGRLPSTPPATDHITRGQTV